VPQFTVQPQELHSVGMEMYVGPMHLGALNEAWDTLPQSLRFFESVDIMDWFAKLLLRNLNWWYSLFNSYGIAIIMLTVLVRMAMLPLMLKSMRSMKRMQLLAPELKELQEKYKDDQQELSKQMMSFYRERGVNPLSGCFPMLLQLPVFITLYRMLWNAYELRGSSFLWIEDLTQADKLFHIPFIASVPFIGGFFEYFNLLPILSGIAMLLSMKFTPASGPAVNPQQKMMMRIMPVLMTVMFYNFASGLNLYVLTSTVIGILQQQLVRAVDVKPPEKIEKKEVRKGKKQDFYARAKERQRQMNKRAKKRKKTKR
jgi:YidC/Oxa1 family membrane protein insertase